MNPPVEVLHPFGVDVAVEDDPMTLRALCANVVDDLAEDVREEAVVPFASGRIERAVKRLLRNCLWVDNVRDAFDAGQALERGEEDSPCGRLSRCRRADHHQAVLDVLDLVELDDLLQPDLIGDEVPLGAHGEDVLLELVEVDGDIFDSGEDVGEKAEERSMSEQTFEMRA